MRMAKCAWRLGKVGLGVSNPSDLAYGCLLYLSGENAFPLNENLNMICCTLNAIRLTLNSEWRNAPGVWPRSVLTVSSPSDLAYGCLLYLSGENDLPLNKNLNMIRCTLNAIRRAFGQSKFRPFQTQLFLPDRSFLIFCRY